MVLVIVSVWVAVVVMVVTEGVGMMWARREIWAFRLLDLASRMLARLQIKWCRAE